MNSKVTLIVSPNENDRNLTVELLHESGIEAQSSTKLRNALDGKLDQFGCVVIVEEALIENEMESFRGALRTQPSWSDLPILVVTAHETVSSALIDQVFPDVGNITLLGRPLSPTVLVSSIKGALRSRLRQFEVRDLLRQRDESLKHRDEFLAMLAHELRNPLAPIRNAVYLQKQLKMQDPVFERTRDAIDRQSNNLTRLVNDLLDISRLELGKVQLQRCEMDINEAVRHAIDACSEIIRERRQSLRVHLDYKPTTINGDMMRIEQVICNLLTNAAKYTPENGYITVSSRRNGDHVEISIEDTGMGIPPALLESIFDLFTQNKRSLARSEGGLGIGLTVARRLIELHGGKIFASSGGDNAGSCFEISLPAVQPAATAANAADESVLGTQKHTILVVEDNADIRDTLELMLRQWGHEVHFAETGPEGVKSALSIHPSIALIDIGLPELDGYEVARSIRSGTADWPNSIRLVAMTGYGQDSDKLRAKDAGFDSHLLKPVDPSVLETMLSR